MKQIKKALAVVLSLAMVLGTLTVTAYAANTANKVISENGTYTMDGNWYGSTSSGTKTGVALTVNNGVTATVNRANYQIYGKVVTKNAVINNGTLTLNHADSYVYNFTNSDKATIQNNGTLTLGAGTMVAQVDSAALATPVTTGKGAIENNGTLDVNGAIVAGAITGTGTITANLTSGYFYDDMSNYVASGYECVALTTAEQTTYPGCNYKVKQKPVCMIDDTEYYTFDSALTAVADGETIKLVDDCTKDSTVTTVDGKAITINLNGHNLTSTQTGIGTSARMFLVTTGTLTIDDTSEGAPGIVTPGTACTQTGAIVQAKTSGSVYIKNGRFHEGGAENSDFYKTTDCTGTYAISGGYFTDNSKTNVSKYATATSGTPEVVADDTYTGYGWTIASYEASVTIGDTTTKYATLAAAFTAAAAESSVATVTMLSDVTTSGLGTINTSNAITLDLNGKIITSTGQFIKNQIAGGFTISDSVGTGKITTTYTYISNGFIYHNTGATLTINGGTIESAQTSGYLVNASGFKVAHIVVNGGTFKSSGATLVRTNTSDVTVNAGVFNADPETSVVSTEGTKTINGEVTSSEGMYTVTKYVASVTVGSTTNSYTSLAAAFTAAAAELSAATITLLDNIKIKGLGQIDASNAITLDLNGKIITSTGQFIKSKIAGGFTISDSVGTGKITTTSTSLSTGLIYNNIGATLTINGGTFESAQTENYLINSSGFSAGHIVVNGGTFKSSGATLVRTNTSDVTVNAGVFNADLETSVVSTEGTKTINGEVTSSEGMYTVTRYVASVKIGETTTKYTSLESAFAAIDGVIEATIATITLLNDVVVTSRIATTGQSDATTKRDITLDLNNHKITYTGSTGLVLLRAYNNLTITDNSDSEGGEIDASASGGKKTIVANNNNSTATFEKGTFRGNYISYTGYNNLATIKGGLYYFDPSYSTNDSETKSNIIEGTVITIEEGKYTVGVCRIGDKGYATLPDAVADAVNNDTIVICSNIVLTNPLQINKSGGVGTSVENLTFKDDGIKRRIDLKMSNVSTGGIVIGAGKTVSFTGTAADNLVIRGYGAATGSETENTYCDKPAIAMAGSGEGVLNLTNVRMIYCKPTRKAETSNGGAIYNPNALNTVNIDGCSFENNQATYGSVVYSNGTLNITNSIIGKTDDTEYSAANVSTKGGTIYNTGSGTVTISNTSIIYNKANRGAAIYNSGASANINLGANTIITKNKSESAGGAIYFYSKSENTGKIYLNGTGIQVTDNKENTVIKGQDDSGDKEVDGNASNINVKNMDSIIVTSDISDGTIGLDYINSSAAADLLPVTASGYTFDQDDVLSLKCDANDDLKAYLRTPSEELPYVAIWGTYQYSVTVGDTITPKGTSFDYKLNEVSVSQDIYQDASVISIVVDSGSFTIPWSSMNETLKNRIVRISTLDTGDTLYNSGDTEKEAEIKLPTDESKEYKAITIYVNEDNRLTDQEIIDFVKLPIYEVESNAVAQKIYVGLQPEFIPSTDEDAQGYYFAGGFYTYHKTMSLRWSEADNDATSRGAHLVTINSAIENSIVHAILGKNAAWLGAIKIYDSWYWQRGFWAGTKITGNTTTTEGYNGAYTNFANTDPFCDVTFGRLYMTNAGKWKEADGESTTDDGGKSIGYLGMLDDEYSKVPVASINMTRTDKDVLTAVSADYEDGLEMSYYFTFSDATKADATAKVKIKIGDLPASEFSVSNIIAGEATADGDYKITVPVMPKCMADKVTISIVKNSGVTEVKYGSGDGYNLQYYAYKAIVNNEENESDVYTRVYSNDFSAMAQALLHYGSATQSQFGWNIIHLADAAISETHPASAVPTDTEFLNNKASGTFTQGTTNTITSVALVSDSTTGLRIYYTGNAASISVNGGAKEYTSDSEGGENYIQFSIASKDLSRFYTAQIGDASCQLNAYYVIKQIMDYKSSTPEARTTAYRLYEFGEAAATYFGAYKASVDRQYALINTAFAYLQKSEFVDYDQKQMTADSNYVGYDNEPRRQVVVTPEDASAAQKVYMDCSSFVYDIYNITFGSEATQLAFGYDEVKTNPTVTTGELIKHLGVYEKGQDNKSKTLETQDGGLEKIYEDLRANLQPGDLIVKYRYKDGSTSAHGHVVVWVGDGFIHCTGSSYEYDKNTDNVDDNAIFYVSAADLEEGFGLTGFHYVKILRPLKYMADNDVAITTQGTSRQQIGETGFDVYGTRENGEILYNGQGVKVGETIRYVVDIDNEKREGEFNIAREFDYEFTLPSGVTFTSASDGGTLVDGTIKWTDISVPANSKKQLTFDVVVNSDYEQDDFGNNVIKYAADAGKATLCTAGSDAALVTMTCINTPVEGTEENADTILSTIRAYRDGTDTPSSYGLALVNSIYGKTNFNNTYTTDLSLFREQSIGSSKFVGLAKTHSSSYKALMYAASTLASNVCYDYLASNLIGGRRLRNFGTIPEMIDLDHRARSFTTNNLMVGDVVACASFNNTWDASNMTYTYYIYLGAEEDMLQINSNSVTTAKPAEVMDKLLGAYDIFAVLRFLGR